MTLLAPEKINPSELPALPFAERAQLPNIAAIYFVIDAEQHILYIGRAKSLCFRWQSHHRLADFRNGLNLRIAYLAVTDSTLLSAIEKALIVYFDPPLNRSNTVMARTKGVAKPKVNTMLRIPQHTYDACVVYAEQDGRSVNGLLVKVIEKWLHEVESKDFLSEVLFSSENTTPTRPAAVAEG